MGNNAITADIHQQRYNWLRCNLPVIIQPLIDVKNGNALRCVFVDFTDDSSECSLALVYDSEASYNRFKPDWLSHIGTFWYRSYNLWLYGRTSDVNHMCF